MIEFIVELLVSVGLCAVVAFFLFLGTAEEDTAFDDPDFQYGDGARAEHRTDRRRGFSDKATADGHGGGGDRTGAPPDLWHRVRRSLHISQEQWDAIVALRDAAWTALVGPNSVLGRDRDDEATGAIAEILNRRRQLQGNRRPSAIDVPREGSSDTSGAMSDQAARGDGRAPTGAANGISEGSQWLGPLTRWLCVLLLGGGTTHPQVWANRMQWLVVKGVGKVNGKWDEAVAKRRRCAAHSTTAPRQLGARRECRPARRKRAPLLTFNHLTLGRGTFIFQSTAHVAATAGTAMGPPPVVAGLHDTPPLSGVTAQGADTSAELQPQSQQQRTSTSGDAGVATSVGAGRHLPGVPVSLSSTTHPVRAEGGGATAGDGAVDAPALGVMGTVLDGNVNLAHHGLGSGSGGAAAASAGGGPALGVVLPRVAGDILSFECFHATTAAHADGDDADRHHAGCHSVGGDMRLRRGGESDGGGVAEVRALGAVGARRGSAGPGPGRPVKPARVPATRTFLVPVVYEDQHFQLCLDCSLPVTALLPAPLNLLIPRDVLTVDCAVDISRVVFHGRVHLAFRGTVFEVSFPEPPHFTAVVSIANPYLQSGNGAPVSFGGAMTRSGAAPPLMASPGDGSGGLGGDGTAVGAGAGASRHGPAAPHQGTGANAHVSPQDRLSKTQEVLLNAIRCTVGKMTYPNVLRGQLHSVASAGTEARPPPAPAYTQGRTPTGQCRDFSFLLCSDDEEEPPGLIDWNLSTASIPLFTC